MTNTQIRPMLAAQYDPAVTAKHLATDGYLLIQPKIDGMRVLFDDGVARSRSWKAWTNRYLQAFAKDHAELIHGWDGEMVPGHSYDPDIFRQAMRGLRSEDGSKEFTIYLFDNFDPSYVQLSFEQRYFGIWKDLEQSPVFEIGDECTPDYTRMASLEYSGHFVGANYHVIVRLCPTWKVESLEEIDARETQLLLEGWEGAILRRKGSRYKWNRATTNEGALTKIKRFEDAEAVILAVEPAYQNNNEATQSALGYTARSAHQDNLVAKDYVGALHVAMDSGKGDSQGVQFKIGVFKGPSLDDRRLWLQRQNELIGKVVKFTHQGYGGGYDLPRTPVFIGFRDPIDL